MLFVGNGAVIWAEQNLASSLVAVLVSAAPIWFVLLDKPKWNENFKSLRYYIRAYSGAHWGGIAF